MALTNGVMILRRLRIPAALTTCVVPVPSLQTGSTNYGVKLSK